MNFADYINQCKNKIRQARPSASAEVIECNSPFIMRPNNSNQQGILLIHGFLDSPFVMRDLAKVFQGRGYLVYAILLPGHGTTPEELAHVSCNDWIATVEFGMNALKQEVTDLSIAGFSTGATLALHYAYSHPHQPLKKIYCFSPACAIKSKLAFLTGLISWLGHYIPRCQFLKKYQEDDPVKYRTLMLNGAWQVYKLTHKIRHITLTCPLFFAISEQDETVSFASALSFFKNQKNPCNNMVVFSNRDYPSEKNIAVIRSDKPDQHILCLSHHGMMVSPDNSHYGAQGDYTLKYPADYYGNVLVTTQRRDGKRVSRLFYNPGFSALVAWV